MNDDVRIDVAVRTLVLLTPILLAIFTQPASAQTSQLSQGTAILAASKPTPRVQRASLTSGIDVDATISRHQSPFITKPQGTGPVNCFLSPEQEQQDIDDCADEGGEWNGNDCSCSVGSPGGGGGGGCVRPTTEASSAVGRWLVTITAFQQSVIAIGNPSGLMVHESSPYPGINGCWYTGAPFDPTSTVSGGEWTIGGWDPNPLLLSINGPYQWGSDIDGDTPALIGTIRAHAALPCTDNVPQTMASQTSCNLGFYNTYFFNTQTVTITSATVTNCRAGVCDTINY